MPFELLVVFVFRARSFVMFRLRAFATWVAVFLSVRCFVRRAVSGTDKLTDSVGFENKLSDFEISIAEKARETFGSVTSEMGGFFLSIAQARNASSAAFGSELARLSKSGSEAFKTAFCAATSFLDSLGVVMSDGCCHIRLGVATRKMKS